MAGINKVILVGHLGKDPEVRQIAPNQTVCQFRIATSENWVDKSGQKQERTEWHSIVVWGKMADICGKYLAKGRQVYVEGRLQTRSWEDQQGQKRYTTEIVASTVQFLGGMGAERSAGGASANAGFGSSNYGPTDFGPEPTFDTNDEIPF
ncbi:MAG: hypothetical protein RJB66_357 [Pseudomonadota bacterium]|jgi:single-strand DNA-binding protein